MTQDEIIEMARQAHLGVTLTHSGEVGQFIEGSNWTEEIEAFAKLVAAKATDEANARSNTSWTLMCKKMVEDERERIAKQWDGRMYGDCEDIDIGAAIRNRGEA